MTSCFSWSSAFRWWPILISGLLAGCTPSDDKACTIFSSDFEQFEGWVSPLPAFLTQEQAHSGRHSYSMSPDEEFGLGYTTTLSQCRFVPQKLRLSGWAYLPNGRVRTAILVVSINCHGRRPDVWQGLNLDISVARYQVWVPLFKYIDLPDDLLPTDELTFHVWRSEKGELAFLDDLKLEGLQ
ncbi:hypothetical protein [Hymenobacter algoricola]|uniref:Lipoprotein n=1 Tax=Hymenobacter algoricola TaxID=486267 RepID=A0ABP7N336_9BACT